MMNGIPILNKSITDGYSDPMPQGCLGKFTITCFSNGAWDGESIAMWYCDTNSTDATDYAPLELNGEQVIFTANGGVVVEHLNPGAFLIAQMSGSGMSTTPKSVFMG